MHQRTIKKPVSLSGIGLHSGKTTQVTIQPANPNMGIVFVRSDMPGAPSVRAHYENVKNTQLATTIGRDSVTVSTVEHVLAALAGLGVDNAVVVVDGPEVPIMDGSSAAFVEAIQSVGLQTQIQPRNVLNILKRVEVKADGKWAVVEPSAGFEIHASIEWDHPIIGYQELNYQDGRGAFEEIASARTFGMLRDVEGLKKMGLARGGSLDNAVVLDDTRVLNPDGLRTPDEFVRHKVLDAIGDLKLGGFAIQGSFRFHRSGHDLHYKLLAAIFSNPANYEIVKATEEKEKKVAKKPRLAVAAAY